MSELADIERARRDAQPTGIAAWRNQYVRSPSFSSGGATRLRETYLALAGPHAYFAWMIASTRRDWRGAIAASLKTVAADELDMTEAQLQRTVQRIKADRLAKQKREARRLRRRKRGYR